MKIYSTKNVKRQNQTGIVTMEMLLAMSLIVIVFSAVIMVVFSNQTAVADSEANNVALYKVLGLLEEARATAADDFNSLVSIASTTDGFIDEKKLDVLSVSACLKQATASAGWDYERRQLGIELSTYISSVAAVEAMGGDCITTPVSTSWKNPATLSTQEIVPGGNQGTDLDVIKRDGNKYAFLTSQKPPASEADLWIIDVTDSSNPSILNDPALDTGPGLVSIDVARQNGTDNYYAYVANDFNSDQLQVIDVTDMSNPVLVASRSLPGVDSAGSYPEGRVVFFHNDRVYIGTAETAGPEFHVYDVSDPTNPIHLGSRELTHNVNDIMVQGSFAYLATSDNSGELMMIDISAPGSMVHPDTAGTKFDAPGDQDGTVLFVSGNTVYLGRKRGDATNNDFYVVDTSTPTSITALGSVDLNMAPSTSEVTGLLVIGNLAFMGTSDANEEFQVWNVADPANLVRCAFFNFPEQAVGLDFVDNLVYAAVRSNDALHVIYDNTP